MADQPTTRADEQNGPQSTCTTEWHTHTVEQTAPGV